RTEEDEDPERDRQGYPEDEKDERDAHAVDQGDEDRPAHIAGERCPRPPAGLGHMRDGPGREERDDPAPDALAVVEEEERREQSQEEPRDDLADDCRGADCATEDLVPVLLQRLPDVVTDVVEVLVINTKRRPSEPFLRIID